MKYRLDLNLAELEMLKKILKVYENKDSYDDLETDYFLSLKKQIQNPKEIKYSGAKGSAALKATEVRSKRAKEKIDNAINILRMENKPITYYSISKVGNVSYITVTKYLTDDDIISLNEIE
jgi:hypothetical protein